MSDQMTRDSKTTCTGIACYTTTNPPPRALSRTQAQMVRMELGTLPFSHTSQAILAHINKNSRKSVERKMNERMSETSVDAVTIYPFFCWGMSSLFSIVHFITVMWYISCTVTSWACAHTTLGLVSGHRFAGSPAWIPSSLPEITNHSSKCL